MRTSYALGSLSATSAPFPPCPLGQAPGHRRHRRPGGPRPSLRAPRPAYEHLALEHLYGVRWAPL